MKQTLLSLCDTYEELVEVSLNLRASRTPTERRYLKERIFDLNDHISSIKDSLEDIYLT